MYRGQGKFVSIFGVAVYLWCGASVSAQPCFIDADCNDGIFCTLDRCFFGNCSNVHNDGQCNDGMDCNGQETCSMVTDSCAAGTPIQCPGGQFCSNIFNRCVFCENNSQCADGQFCNGVEICNAGLCQDGEDVDCSFLDTECIEGFCNEVVDQCQQHPPCFDDDLCTNDICVVGTGCANPFNYNVGVECCNPATGVITPINDSNACTQDTCNVVTGQVSHTVISCNDNNACTVDDHCINNGAGCVGTNVNTISCDETADCPRGTCDVPAGHCECVVCATDPQCNDNVSCTADTCDTQTGVCSNVANDAACATGLFCQQRICDPNSAGTGCVLANLCTPTAGNPCASPAGCNETNDNCGGCPPPTVAVTSRYVTITPPGTGATQIAFRVAGDCTDGGVACVAKYVDFDSPVVPADPTAARLVNAAVFKTAAAWGTVNVRSLDLQPNRRYRISTECNPGAVRSASVAVQLWRWGDNNNSGTANFTDISREVDGFRNFFTADLTKEKTDIVGSDTCNSQPNRVVNFIDVSANVDAFRSLPFPCSPRCP